jgi:hypothetical protein
LATQTFAFMVSQQGRVSSSSLFMSDGAKKSGTVKWYVASSGV